MNWMQFLAAFEVLNERKRWFPRSLTREEQQRWKQMRRAIENALFRQDYRKRHDSRQFLRVPVRLKGVFLGQAKRTECVITTLGEGGCFIPTEKPLPAKTQLFLTVYPVNGDSWVIEGEVAWAKEVGDPGVAGMGIRFINATAIQREAIYSAVDRVLRSRLGDGCPITAPAPELQTSV